MNTKFFVNRRWYKSPCKAVLNADAFTVKFFTGKHTIIANVSDKCYFASIDNISLSDIKCDFYFSRNYTSPKEFLTNLYDTFKCFLNTSIPFSERHFPHSTDDVIRRIIELQEMKKEQLENANVNDYAKPEKELFETVDTHLDDVKKFKEKSELNTNYDVVADENFHQLTKTLIKSLFKAIGIQDTRKIHFTISNGLVFFNYKGTQYKYYSAQCKIFKKCGRKYQRINWKDFSDDNSPNDQKRVGGRSPPFTPDIRSENIDKLKIKE